MAVHLRHWCPGCNLKKKKTSSRFNSPYETSRKPNSCGWWQQLGCPDGGWCGYDTNLSQIQWCSAWEGSRLTSQSLIGRPDFPPVQGTKSSKCSRTTPWRAVCLLFLITKTYVGKAEDESKYAKDCAEYSMTQKQGSMDSKNSTQRLYKELYNINKLWDYAKKLIFFSFMSSLHVCKQGSING